MKRSVRLLFLPLRKNKNFLKWENSKEWVESTQGNWIKMDPSKGTLSFSLCFLHASSLLCLIPGDKIEYQGIWGFECKYEPCKFSQVAPGMKARLKSFPVKEQKYLWCIVDNTSKDILPWGQSIVLHTIKEGLCRGWVKVQICGGKERKLARV